MLLVDGYVRRVHGDLSVREDAVDGDAGLRGPGQGWSQRKRGGRRCPGGQHLPSGAHLEVQP